MNDCSGFFQCEMARVIRARLLALRRTTLFRFAAVHEDVRNWFAVAGGNDTDQNVLSLAEDGRTSNKRGNRSDTSKNPEQAERCKRRFSYLGGPKRNGDALILCELGCASEN